MRKFLSLLLVVLMITSLFGAAFAEEMTAVGTPRTETLIVETQTPTDVPGQFNSYMQGTQMGFGIGSPIVATVILFVGLFMLITGYNDYLSKMRGR